MFTTDATCDCGDSSQFKKQGFCNHHKGLEDSESQDVMGKELRSLYITIFSALFYHLQKVITSDNEKTLQIFEWIDQHQELGDPIRNCFCHVLNDMVSVKKLFVNLLQADAQVADVFFKIISEVSNIPYFRDNINVRIFKAIPKILEAAVSVIIAGNDNDFLFIEQHPVRIIIRTFFHLFPNEYISTLSDNIDWPSIFIDIFKNATVLYHSINNKKRFEALNFDLLVQKFNLFLGRGTNTDKKVRYVEQLADFLVDTEGEPKESRNIGDKKDDVLNYKDILWVLFLEITSTLHEINRQGVFSAHVFDAYVKWLEKNSDFGYSSILDPSTTFTFSVSLHILVLRMLFMSGDAKKWISYMAEKSHRTVDQLCFDIALLPAKLLACLTYLHSNAFVRNEDTIVTGLYMITYKGQVENNYIPLFSGVQLLFEICNDKERFMHNIATVFGVFTHTENEKSIDRKTNFLYFALCMALNRISCNNSTLEIAEETVRTLLVSGTDDIQVIEMLVHVKENGVNYLDIAISNNATRVFANGVQLLKANPDLEWNLFVPWIPFLMINKQIDIFNQKNKNKPFPVSVPDTNQELLKILDLNIVRKVVLSRLNKNNDSQFVMSYLMACLKRFGVQRKEKKELSVDNLPTDFSEFFFADVKIGDKTVCIFDTLQKTAIGTALIEKTGLVSSDNKDQSDALERKKRALEAKKRAMTSIATDQMNFGDIEEENEEEETTSDVLCSVCHAQNDSPLFYNALYQRTIIPCLIDKTPIKSTTVFDICKHVVHKGCIDTTNNVWMCPMDRMIKNLLIPVVQTDFSERVDLSNVAGIEEFKAVFPEQLTQAEAAETLNSILTLLDAHERINKNVLNSEGEQLVLRAIFPIFWSLRYEQSEYTDQEKPMAMLLFRLIGSDKPREKYSELVSEIYPSLPHEKRLCFLRRAAIFESIVLSSEKQRFFEWAEILSHKSLTEHFKLAETEFSEVKPVQFMKIPENPVELYRNMDHSKMDTMQTYSIFTGEIFESFGIIEYLQNELDGAYAPFIFLTGGNELTVVLTDPTMRMFEPLPPLYMTSTGNENIGLNIWEPMKLDQQRYRMMEEMFLSMHHLKYINIQ